MRNRILVIIFLVLIGSMIFTTNIHIYEKTLATRNIAGIRGISQRSITKVIDRFYDGSIEPKRITPGEPYDEFRYAVVIGISQGNLEHADDDAIEWKNYLESKHYAVKLLLNKQATAQAIKDAINWLISVSNYNTRVAFIYSGHGITIYEGITPLEYSTSPYGTSITPYTYPRRYRILSAIISWDGVAITQDYFNDAFSKLVAKQAFFFFDACKIGGMRVLADEVSESGRVVAMASDQNTDTDELNSVGHGVFTYYFLIVNLETGKLKVEQAFYETEEYIESHYQNLNPTIADTYPTATDNSGMMEL